MNRNLYRIVFNVKRGQLMAVAETASSQGKDAGERRGSGTSGGLLAALHPVCFAVLAALGMAAPLTQAQIVADPNAPRNQRPIVLAAPNGVPLVNIPTPSAAGLSRLAVIQYDVQANGAILNNSRTDVQTQLGGFVRGNPMLATGSARGIVIEVNGNNPTNLNGPTEIAGPRTPLIIANPSGIQVNGASFLNTSNLTLTTGTPVYNGGGGIDSYRVQGGTVSINGLGLDASTAGATAIIARAVQVNASLYADQLQIITGANSISASDPGIATPIAGTGPRPAFALDAGLLSGMYANSIIFKSTEDGLGIIHKGTLGVTASALFQVNGGVNNQGTIQAQVNAQIQANGKVSNSGQMSAGQALMIDASAALDNSAGSLSAPRLDISAASLANRGGSIEQTGAQALSLQSQSVSNAAGGQIGHQHQQIK